MEKTEEKKKGNKTPNRVYPYESKAIAVKSRELMVMSQCIMAKASKTYKYQIGSDVVRYTSKLGYCIYDALDQMGFNDEKIQKITKILDWIRMCALTVRVAKDLNCLSNDLFEQYVNSLVSLKNQTENWKHFVEEKKKEEQNSTSADVENKTTQPIQLATPLTDPSEQEADVNVTETK